MSDRVAQEWDDINIELRLPPSTEEWAEELFKSIDSCTFCNRDDMALVVRFVIGGNCDGAYNLSDVMRNVEKAMTEGEISLNEFEVKVWATESERERERREASA